MQGEKLQQLVQYTNVRSNGRGAGPAAGPAALLPQFAACVPHRRWWLFRWRAVDCAGLRLEPLVSVLSIGEYKRAPESVAYERVNLA